MIVLRLQTVWTRDTAQSANTKLACSGRVASLRPGAQDWTLDAGHATHWLARLQPGAQDWTLDTGLRNFLHLDFLRLHTDICSREGLVRVHQECPSAGLVILFSLANFAVQAHMAQLQPLATAVREVAPAEDRLTNRCL